MSASLFEAREWSGQGDRKIRVISGASPAESSMQFSTRLANTTCFGRGNGPEHGRAEERLQMKFNAMEAGFSWD